MQQNAQIQYNMKNTILIVNRSFGGTYRLHLQCQISLAVKAGGKSIDFQRSALRSIPEQGSLQA
jgi:hypothetical protein